MTRRTSARCCTGTRLAQNSVDDYRWISVVKACNRAVRRVAGADTDEHLLRETRAKYADWLDRDHLDQSWTAVLEILDALATARPGRREHATAERIDLLDATDTWLRTYSTVVALGCVDGEWPQRPHGALPKELRAAINQEATAEADKEGEGDTSDDVPDESEAEDDIIVA